MQTRLTAQILASDTGREAETILRACVHCGFCTATCPTYQLLGDELDGPRGRIYQIKQLLEGAGPTASVQQHLDRCLLCRGCETTCPSGVAYGRLLEIGRGYMADHHRRHIADGVFRWLLRKILPHSRRFSLLLALGRGIRPLLPERHRRSIPDKRTTSATSWPAPIHPRKMLILDGCVQPSLAPSINLAAAQVMDRLGISLIRTPQASCCGAVEHHLDDHRASRNRARRNIDLWWPLLNGEAEALVITASGCAQMAKEYDHLLADDPHYAEKARQIASRTRDIAEIIDNEDLASLRGDLDPRSRVAFHASCTLQHGQGLSGVVERILLRLGYRLTPVSDAHLCCGSAGAYSLLHPRLADELGRQKSARLQAGEPELIATANIGCLTHLQKSANRPVVHWIELLNPE
ncbi:MAG: glycolate oxidase subunit GlcF [Candidatus Thiodiazotropha sp. (ex Dulcina madagascariensis)]|nr:glycolate oxidase subunit GlcF [Candidatus Thiodiazotropha sp. (ex Dulcina madagascariensis)]MCU7926493.1 glycolate oxidase subunit GlcF [Candidatus Thiodiazotropha sp. (ex Dulcina madagascariensis)]